MAKKKTEEEPQPVVDEYSRQLESDEPTEELGGDARGDAKLQAMLETEGMEHKFDDLKSDVEGMQQDE